MLPLTVCTSSLFAEIVKLNGLYYSLGTTTATVAADQSSDKSVYSAYTSVTIPATVAYNNYTYPVTTICYKHRLSRKHNSDHAEVQEDKEATD